MDEVLDPALFVLEGEPASAVDTRSVVRDFMIPLAMELLGREKEWKRRLGRTLSFARAYYRSAWTAAEIDRLAVLGAARRHEIARELQAKNPDLPQADIDAAAARTALPTIGKSIAGEMAYDEQVFGSLAQPADKDMENEFRAGFLQVVGEELMQRALDAGKDK